ncbi:hypothetical protein [Thiomicrorhabdus aquaedulcis]|uniref:hypothetical protein n=1 Tax=Thiomicrorhabdus aquaedulcis TaxID=2211106 RepID=UPI000FDC4A03|nr:hypothetical protein [Thiomicrorhabdus aquaedulcis]
MKKIIASLTLAAVFTLTGCSISPMIQEDSKEWYPNGYSVKVSNFDRIPDKKINLQFKVAEGANIENFEWTETQAEVKTRLKENGVELTETGRPVTVIINDFTAFGSNHAVVRDPKTIIPGGAVLMAGGSVAQDLVARAIDRKVAQDEANKVQPTNDIKSGDGKHFSPEVTFSIESPQDEYKTSVTMRSARAIYSYLASSKQVTVQAISEFFTATK